MRIGIFGLSLALAACGGGVVDDDDGYVPVPWTGEGRQGVDPVAPEDPAEGGADVDEPDPDPDPAEPDPVEPDPVEPDPVEPDPPADPNGWSPAWASLEDQMLVLVNEMRVNGGRCPSGNYGPRGALVMNQELRTAARLHSKDMADNDYFDHNSQNGDSPWDRIDAAGYSAQAVGENIAAGNGTAADTFEQWVNSDGHCRNMMSSDATEIGVGYANGNASYGHYWTQTFGSR
jgi:uncharacterized protein YkwD